MSVDLEKNRVIDAWKTRDSHDFAYFDKVEAMVAPFWAWDSSFNRLFRRLDTTETVEIAAGIGRHSAQIVDRCRRLYLVDTSVDGIEQAKQRFVEHPHVSCHHSIDGESLPFLEDQSVTSVFCFDAMVHFEALTMFRYISETARVLKPDGMALFHHSNYTKNPTGKFTDNPGWRNYMSNDLLAHVASRNGFSVVEQIVIDWAEPQSDGLTLLQKI